MAEVPGPSEPVMPVKPAVSGVWLLSGMTDGVEKVFVKEKVLAKDGVGCVKGLRACHFVGLHGASRRGRMGGGNPEW